MENVENNEKQYNGIDRTKFIENIKYTENELLKLQKQFDEGKIDKSQLSKEQIADLTKLYKEQVNE